jgi:hypothetical protein
MIMMMMMMNIAVALAGHVDHIGPCQEKTYRSYSYPRIKVSTSKDKMIEVLHLIHNSSC